MEDELYDIYIKSSNLISKTDKGSNLLYNISNEQYWKVIKWIFEIMNDYNLSIDSLWLSIYLFSKCLIKKYIPIGRLQLYASTCVFIASKYEETYFISVNELVYLCDGLYKKNDFLECEMIILRVLEYKIFVSNPYSLSYSLLNFMGIRVDNVDKLDKIFFSVLKVKRIQYYSVSNLANAILEIYEREDEKNYYKVIINLLNKQS